MAIDLVLAQRPAAVEVPTLLGMSLRTAEQTLRERQLELGDISRQPRSDVALNTVIGEFPKAGERAAVGSKIDLELSEEAPSVPVASKKGTAIKGSPLSRQASPPLVMIEVPPLVGQSLQAAEQTLQERQLGIGNISRQPRPDAAQNTVLSQLPKPGEKVNAGSTVDLVMPAEIPIVPKLPRPRPSPPVTISRASCVVAGPNTFRIEMAGTVTVPVEQKCLFYAEASGPGGGTRWRPRCQSWGAADPGDGPLSNVSCVHRPNDPSENEWQTITTVTLQNIPTEVYAGIISDGKKLGGASKPLTCAP